MPPILKIELLGGFRVFLDMEPVNGFVSNKARALLAYIAMTDKPQSRQVLAELFWGNKPDAAANSNLRMALSNLRTVVGPYLRITRSEVAIEPASHLELDVEAFQARLSAREGDIQSMEEAVALYQGDLLEGFLVRDAQSFEEWALWQRERLRQMAMQALYQLSMHHTERGDYDTALDYTRRLLQLEPWQEEGHRQMMLLLALTGNRSGALAQYETCRRILADELHVDPLPETNALLERIKAMPQAPAGNNGSAGEVRGHPLPRSTLFGRQEEFSWLLQEWKQIQPQRGRLTLVEGEMGIGKTRLVEDVLHHIATTQTRILRARCHEFSHELPYQPVVDLLRMGLKQHPEIVAGLSPVWLAQLAVLLPELQERTAHGSSNMTLGDNGLARQHLFEAVHQFLRTLIDSTSPASNATRAAPPARGNQTHERTAQPGHRTAQQPQRLVIFLDDLHWIDGPSVDLLRYLAYRLHEDPIWLIGAYQSQGIAAEHPFLRLRRALIGEEHIGVLSLTPLATTAILDWVAALPGLEASQVHPLAELIVRRAEGNPFVTSQVLRELRESSSVQHVGSRWRLQPGWPAQVGQIPFAVREIVLLKLGRLNPGCLELFSTAAVIGESFDLATLQQMSSGVEDIQMCVFDWLEQGLVTAVQPGTYKFSHGMYREVAAEWLSPWHRLRAGNRPARNEQSSAGNVVRLPAARPTGT